MDRSGRPVHVSRDASNPVGTTEVVISIPRRASPKIRFQDLAGPNWNGGQILTGVSWNEGFTDPGNPNDPVKAVKTRHITIRNSQAGGGNDLQISLNGGNDWVTLQPGESYEQFVALYCFKARGVGGDTTFEAIALI